MIYKQYIPSLGRDLDFRSETRAIRLGRWSGGTVDHFRNISKIFCLGFEFFTNPYIFFLDFGRFEKK